MVDADEGPGLAGGLGGFRDSFGGWFAEVVPASAAAPSVPVAGISCDFDPWHQNRDPCRLVAGQSGSDRAVVVRNGEEIESSLGGRDQYLDRPGIAIREAGVTMEITPVPA